MNRNVLDMCRRVAALRYKHLLNDGTTVSELAADFYAEALVESLETGKPIDWRMIRRAGYRISRALGFAQHNGKPRVRMESCRSFSHDSFLDTPRKYSDYRIPFARGLRGQRMTEAWHKGVKKLDTARP